MRLAKTIGLLCLLVGPICLAQDPFHNSLAWRAQQWVSVQSSSWSPTNIVDTWYYWNYSNLVVGSSVSAWHEIVWNTNDITQTSATLQPTNSSLGVYYDGINDFSSNAAPFLTSYNNTGCLYVIFRPYTPSSDAATVVGGGSAGNGTPGNRALYCNTDNTLRYQGSQGAIVVGSFTPGTELDCLINYNGAAPYQSIIYTNGVLATNGAAGFMGYFGLVGARTDVSRYYKGYIREILFLVKFADSTTISNLHRYATNLYNFSP